MASSRSRSVADEGTPQSLGTSASNHLDEIRVPQTSQQENSSKENSPKHKPHRGTPEGETRRKIARKSTWRSRLLNSLKRKTKRNDVAASSDDTLEATDFSFRQPSRGSSATASNKKRDSPLLELHALKASKRASPSSYEAIRTAIAEDVDGLPHEIRGGTPLHYYVWADNLGKEKTDCLVSLLTAGEVEVDSRTEEGNTPLHLAVKRGDVQSVKLLITFGANVNSLNGSGHTPLDIATMGYIQQERKLTVSNLTHDNCLRKKWRDGSPKALKSDTHQSQKKSPLLSRIVPMRPKFVDFHLGGDLKGWMQVDFTDGTPPVAKRPVSFEGVEVRVRDLTDPVHITMDDMHIRQPAASTQVSTPKFTARSSSATLKQEEELRQSYDYILNLLHATGGMTFHKLQNMSSKPLSLSGKHATPDLSIELQRSIKLAEYQDGTTILNLYEALEDTINSKMEELSSLGNFDEALGLALQQQEMKRYNKTLLRKGPEDRVDMGTRAGSRILCLDGGGIRGLIQIEVLSQIERVTGRRIVDLFDWIIGTSTGALIALCLTYAEMSLEEVRRLYFKMKSEVFTGSSYGFDTAALERLLKEAFPPKMRMNWPTSHSANVLVSAVYKKMSPPQLRFFNNCFCDKFSTQPVWKVARYTTAAPMFFKECDDYVDGGVLANNPSETGLTAIQNFHHSKGTQLPIALVVSIGSGIYPAEELGRIDVQDFLFFGKQWLNFQDTVRSRARNLIQLLSNALVESETVAENTKARCEGQGIPFYRFSPKLAETVATGETDNAILIDMLITTSVQTVPHMERLCETFLRIAEANQKERFRKRRDNIAAEAATK